MSAQGADRNLLFGVLAWQMDFVTRDALTAAMHAWVVEKNRSLGEILLSRGELAEDEWGILEALVTKHLQKHDQDAGSSLLSLAKATESVPEMRKLLDP